MGLSLYWINRQSAHRAGGGAAVRSILVRFFEQFLYDLRLKRLSPCLFELDGELSRSVQELARREGRSPGETAAGLVAEALAQRKVAEERLNTWQGLTPREQEVAALACLNYTNAEIARSLVIGEETVKSHLQSILRKFGLRRKEELRQALAAWDFSAWGRSKEASGDPEAGDQGKRP